MATLLHNSKLSDSKYKNWIKAGLGVLYTKEGIEPFVYDEIKQFQQKCLSDICNNNGLPAGMVCSSCCTENVVVCPTNRYCNAGRGKCIFHRKSATQYLPSGCPNNVCHNFKNEIQKAHRYYGPSYKNTDASKWCSDPWQVAKCFMPPDGYDDVMSAAETDFNGVISVILNYEAFQTKIHDDLSKKYNIIEQAREVERAVRNSPTMEIEDTDLQQYFTVLLNLLSDPAYLSTNVDAQNAKMKLLKFQNDTLVIGKDDVHNALNDAGNTVPREIRTAHEFKQDAENQKLKLITSTNTAKRKITEMADAGVKHLKSETNAFMTEAISANKDDEYNKFKEGMLPKEILNMDSRSIELYNKALQEGEDNTHNIRLMIVGHFGVGKTTLKKRLFNESVDIKERKSTNGIDVRRCKILKNKTWLTGHSQTVGDRKALLHRIAKIMCNENDKLEEKQQRQENLTPEAAESDEGIKDETKKKGTKINEHDTRIDKGNVKCLPVEALTLEDLRANTIQTDKTGKQDDDSVRRRKHLEELVNEVQHDFLIEDELHCDLSLWDFAGQNIFYATHQAFLSRRAIYLLVLDVSRHIDETVQDDIWHFDCQGEQECKVKEFIEFWLNSIHEFCSLLGGNGPPVILVGTFIDKLKQKSGAERCLYNLRSSLVRKVTNCHLTEQQFYVDNTIEQDENIDQLRQYVVKIASEQSYWGERIPAKWITLEERLIRLKEQQNVKVLQMERLRAENRLLPVPIESDAELELFLKFHHESGTILYFGGEDLSEEILLDPQWLIDAFKSLITSGMFCISNAEVQNKWQKFDRTAVLTQDLIELIWSKDENKEYLIHREIILKLMEKLGFVAKPKRCADVSSKLEEHYFVPCKLKDPPPAKVILWNDSVHMKYTSKLCLTNAEDADKRFLPSTAFNRFISASINQWPLSIQNGKYMIFCGGAVFQLEDNHFLYIFLFEHVIQIWISRLSAEGQYPSVSLCRKTQNQVMKILGENVRMRRSLLSFVKCLHSSLYSNENMVVLQEDSSIRNSDDVQCFCQDNGHVVSYVDMVKYWLPGDMIPRFGQAVCLDLENKPTEKDFSRISRKIGKEFKQVAFELGLSQPEIEHICMDNNTTADKITAILCRWSKRLGENATNGELVKALLDAGVDVVSVFGS